MNLDSRPLSAFATYGDYDSHEAVMARIAAISHHFTQDATASAIDISPKQWELFSAVEATSEAATLTYLGNLLGCSRQNVKKLAVAIEKQDLISLSAGHNNAIHIEITQQGQKFLAEMKRNRKALLKEMFANVTPEDFAALCRVLDALGAHHVAASNN